MSIHEHLATGTTTVCRCWAVAPAGRRDAGFHRPRRDLSFGGTTFRADSGMTARAFQQSTGLSVDNSEAVGALSDDAIRAADLEAGRYDDAAVTMWLVNWRKPAERSVRFAGTIGEVARSGESFRAELRGLAEGLNKAQGMVFQRTCSAVLGDRRCKVDLDRAQVPHRARGRPRCRRQDLRFRHVPRVRERMVRAGSAPHPQRRWRGAQRSRQGGPQHRRGAADRPLAIDPGRGQARRSGEAGRGMRQARRHLHRKFDNLVNFRGFPSIPGEDWLMAYPTDRVPNDGGRR